LLQGLCHKDLVTKTLTQGPCHRNLVTTWGSYNRVLVTGFLSQGSCHKIYSVLRVETSLDSPDRPPRRSSSDGPSFPVAAVGTQSRGVYTAAAKCLLGEPLGADGHVGRPERAARRASSSSIAAAPRNVDGPVLPPAAQVAAPMKDKRGGSGQGQGWRRRRGKSTGRRRCCRGRRVAG
jgi:hypothetical protein